MPDIRVDLRKGELKSRLSQLARRIDNPEELMSEIGDYMVRSTQNRILRQKVDPDGNAWAPLAESTVARKGHSSILFETGDLARSIKVDRHGKTFTVITSDVEYADYMQEGFTHWKSGKRVPARPFMGVSDANNRRIVRMIRNYIEHGSV